ncbi:methyl-accepting chemotaxis protein [Desulfovibrio inopinatus]|uniref:methyl-accepting chemotaxis protein n=1 Tax=Desulfovibrio inopinatus TaxID=102109 RepID=UPI0003F57DA4|nr:methyl-accepting chemotaxis protein [Desulfovibrio inopinatus]
MGRTINCRSISFLLAGIISAITVICVAGIILYVSSSTSQTTRELGEETVEVFTTAILGSLEENIESNISLASVISGQNAIENAALLGDGRLAQKAVTAFLNAYKTTLAIVVFNAQGEILVKESQPGLNVKLDSVSNTDFGQAILTGSESFVSPKVIVLGDDGSGLTFATAKAIVNAEGKNIGGVAIFSDFGSFTKNLLAPISIGKHGYAYLLDADGQFIAHATNSDLVLNKSHNQSFVKQALAQKTGVIDYTWEGQEKVAAVKIVPETGWIVAMSAHVDELDAAAVSQRNILLISGLVIVVLLVNVIMLALGRIVIRPVKQLQNFTEKVAEGDFTAQLQGNNYVCEMLVLKNDIMSMYGMIKEKVGFSDGLLKNLVAPLMVVNVGGELTWLNVEVMKLLDLDGKPEDYLGQDFSQFFYGEKRETNTCRAIKEKKRLFQKTEVTTQKGNLKYISVVSAPLFDLDGNLLGAFTTVMDFTGIKIKEDQLIARNQKVARAAEDANGIADQVASAAEELSAQIEESTRGADYQRNRTSEVATAMEQMNATVLSVAENAARSAEMAEEAKQKAQEGEKNVDDVVRTIALVNTKAEGLKADMSELGKQAEGIGQIMSVINDIADQTNLLALNAAIEAARAGDAGRGFAVVADEVRKLAEKTMTATNEVGQYIRSIQDSAKKNITATEETTQAISGTTETAKMAGAALQEIVAMVEQTADQVRSIATASEEQSAASEQINRSTDEINATASETAEAMVQSAQAVSDLANLSTRLREIITAMQQE